MVKRLVERRKGLMIFSWLGFIIGFLSGVIIMIALGKLGEFIRFTAILKQQQLMKSKEGEEINELTKGIKEGFGVTRTGDKDFPAK